MSETKEEFRQITIDIFMDIFSTKSSRYKRVRAPQKNNTLSRGLLTPVTLRALLITKDCQKARPGNYHNFGNLLQFCLALVNGVLVAVQLRCRCIVKLSCNTYAAASGP